MPRMLSDFAVLLKYRNLMELCFAVLVSMIGFGLIIPLLPIYGREMGASGIYLGLLTSLFGVTRSIISIPGGILADRFGRKKLIMTGLFTYTVVMFLFGLSTNLYQLLFLRACQGAASGIVWPVASTMVADIVPPRDRGKALGFFTMMWDGGIAIGPVLGGFLSAFFSISVPFFVCSGLALLSALIVLKRVKESHMRPKKEETAVKNDIPINVLSLIGVCITGFTVSFATGLVQPILPLFGNEVLELNEAEVGLVFGGMGVIRFFIRPTSGALGDDVGRKKVIMGGLVLNGIFTVAISFSTGFWTLMAFSVVRASGLGMTMPSMQAVVTGLTTREKRGRVMGIFSTWQNAGMVVGPLLGGITFDAFSPQTPFLLCGLVAFAAVGVLMGTVKEPGKGLEEDEEGGVERS